ncbi:MAG: hypothetical protein P8171_25855 [Candidatus Thiodiazotropha sp.]
MALPPLVQYQTELEYRQHFEREYCRGTIETFDGIQVRFRKGMFDHCFFESVNAKDDTFSPRRAEQIDWIKAVLQDPTAALREGWDNIKKQPAKDRRVAVVVNSYVVIIRVRGQRADFVTAFVATGRSIAKIRTNPLWQQN